jgi:multiple sugar transport system substrate-binding protein
MNGLWEDSMNDKVDFQHRGFNRRDVLKTAGAGLAAAALPYIPAMAQDAVELTLWSWLPDLQDQVDLFEAAHPNIKVKLVNAGQGGDEYTKLRAALKAGSGLPDVAHMEFQLVRSFEQLKALADIGQWANAHKDEFADWAWNQVSDGDKVYAMPWDSGPIAVLYRNDVFEKHSIAVPKTWDDFAEQAIKLHEAAPDVFLTDATFSDGGWTNSLLWQAGWRPFEVNGTEISIQVNGEISKKFAAFWQKLLDAKAVEAKPGFVTEWYTSLDEGRYATWITAGWGPVFLTSFAKKSAGQWRGAPIPQWDANKFVSANWGGSTLAALAGSQHPAEAAELAIWLTVDPKATELYTTKQFLFPTRKAILASSDFADKSFDFYGGQAVNKVFAESAKGVDPTFQWSPFQDYVNQTMGDVLGAAAAGKGTLAAAFDSLQDTFVQYAQDQGFTVKT